MKRKLTLMALVYFTLSVGQAASTSGYWVGVFPTYKFGEKHKLSLQAETRRQGSAEFELYRPAYHYKVKNWFNVGLGFDLFTFESEEARYWAELNLKTPKKVFHQRLHLRWRHEFRDLSGVDSSGSRSRVMFVSQFDLVSRWKLELLVFDEVFYAQRAFSGRQNFFDRNWLGVRFRKHVGGSFIDLGGFWEKIFTTSDTSGFVGILSLGHKF